MPGEFEVIARYFSGDEAEDVRCGVGDDAALLDVGTDELVLCVDSLVEGVHFPADAPPETVGHKALAVNLSDLAAMGAEPRWLLLALTLPHVDERWLEAFSRGLRGLAARHDVALVGGDLTRGPLTVSVTAAGKVPRGEALRRRGARVGDDIYVTGTLGDAALGLRRWQQGVRSGAETALIERLHRPEPRVDLGRRLRSLATSCIDLSDGLCQDLGHVLRASGVGAGIESGRLPLSAAAKAAVGEREARLCALTGGDDYELCFSAPADMSTALAALSSEQRLPITRVGVVEEQPGLRVKDIDGRLLDAGVGYTHFAEDG